MRNWLGYLLVGVGLPKSLKICGLGMALVFALEASSLSAAAVRSFSPLGSVKNISQVVVQFSEAVVPLGDAEVVEEPLLGTCNIPLQRLRDRGQKVQEGTLPYTSRWIDGERWSLDFVKPLASGIRCQFRTNPKFQDTKGQALVASEKSFDFHTGGPSILSLLPQPDQAIDGQVNFLLILDAGVEEESLKSAYFEVAEVPGKIPVNLIKGAEKKGILSQDPYLRFLKNSGLSVPKGDGPEQGKHVLLLRAGRTFPENKQVVLHWEQGIRSLTGLARSEAQVFSWWVRENFKAKVECQRANQDRACSPYSDIHITFTRGVRLKDLQGTQLKAKTGKVWQPRDFQDDAGRPRNSEDEVWGISFSSPFPPSSEFEVSLPRTLKASDGSLLENQKTFPVTLKTDITPPLLKFAAPFGILESKANPVLPVSVRNIEFQSAMRQTSFPAQTINLASDSKPAEIIRWYKRVRDKDNSYQDRNQSLFESTAEKKSFSLPTPTQPTSLNLVGIPFPKPGFHVVEIESPILGEVLTREGPMFVAAAALVTDMAVHLKLGRESSLVWVTELASSRSVAEAEISLVNGLGETLFSGKTDKNGLLRIPKTLESNEGENSYEKNEIFAFAKKGEDVSFVSSRWDQGIETYRFQVNQEYLNPRWGPSLMHTILDRVTVKPGEKVHMKHVLRQHVEKGFARVDKKNLPLQVLLVHQGSQQVYPLPFEWDEKTGTALNTFQVPPEAKLGTYSIYLSASPQKKASPEGTEEGQGSGYAFWGDQLTGTFRVAEYRLPLVDAQVKVQGSPLVAPSEVKIDLSAQYLAGGPAQGLKTKLRSMVGGDFFQPDTPETEGMQFFSSPQKVGVFDSYYGYSADDQGDDPSEDLGVQDLTLDKQGGMLATVKGLRPSPVSRRLRLEWEYKDPNGEVRTARSDVPLYPADLAIGVRADEWFAEAGKASAKGIILDLAGKPLAGKAFSIEAFSKTYVTHRKKLAGGFYSYDSKVEIKSLGQVCQGVADPQGRFLCPLPNLKAGEYTLQARALDEKNRVALGRAQISVYSKGVASWYPSGDSDRMDIVAEKSHYEPGETAKVIVRTPYESSQVLVTVEREGVLDAYVSQLNRDKPFVEVPMKGHYAPNVFISVLSVRGRVADPQPTALIDLAKPSLKMGLTSVKVGWKEHRLSVEVIPDKKVYQARDKAQVNIRVKAPSLQALPKNAEVTFIAVDEALLKLKSNQSWDLLAAMMNPRSLAVQTSTAQVQVIGRRHFGLKAQAPGGGGGEGVGLRELFDPMLLWAPSVRLNSEGEATVTVPLNDSMSSFRFIAVALAGDGLFGHASTVVQSTKDLMLLSGFAPLVRSGDKIQNTFTVRNATAQAMTVALSVSSPEVKALPHLADLSLSPSEARVIELPLDVPQGLNQLSFVIEAKDTRSGRRDILKVKQTVAPVWKPEVTQSTLVQLDPNQTLQLKPPKDALPQQGGVLITARPSLVAGLSGVQHYMEEYTYSCLEQKLSRAVALDRRPDLDRFLNQLPSYIDTDGLLKFFPSSSCGSAALSRYVLDILEKEKLKLPELIEAQLVQGLVNSLEARLSCPGDTKDFTRPRAFEAEAKVRTIEVLSRYKRFQPNYLSLIEMTPQSWNSGSVAALARLARREEGFPNRVQVQGEAEQILRSRLNYQGSLLNLQGQLSQEATWQLWTSPDLEAIAVFDYALEAQDLWQTELGRMTRGLLARMQGGTWDTTLSNAAGSSSFRRFRQLFEKEAVAGSTQLSLGPVEETITWDEKPLKNQKSLPWSSPSEPKNQILRLVHEGTGKPWVHVQTTAAIPLKAATDRGYLIQKSLHPVSQKTSGIWSVGDVVDVRLKIDAQADQAWVVVRDSIPAGASHLGSGLEGESSFLDQTKAKGIRAEAWPSEFAERAQGSFVAYAASVPKGTYLLSYRIRLNSAGQFKLSPTRVEAMYAKEMFGEIPYADWKVVP